jgi:hypothetical protein
LGVGTPHAHAEVELGAGLMAPLDSNFCHEISEASCTNVASAGRAGAVGTQAHGLR